MGTNPHLQGRRNQLKGPPYTSSNRIREFVKQAKRGISEPERQALRDALDIHDDKEFAQVLRDLQIQTKAEVAKFQVNSGFDLERWVSQRAAALKKRDLLMTDQQLADYEAHRRFQVGDATRFIGGPRSEPVGNAQIERPQNQEGKIIEVSDHQGTQIIRFRPNDGLPDLVVREFTAGWLCLERITTT